jgi:hypothetical protein
MHQVTQQPAEHAMRTGILGRFLVIGAGAQFLTDPEYQEKAIVGAGAEHEDDQQELGQRGDLEPVVCGLGDERAGNKNRENGGSNSRQRQRQRPEDQHKQRDNEHDRQVLDLVALVA